jgi:PadR family transcriptional regulator PadR
VRLGQRAGRDRPATVEGLLEASLLLALTGGEGYGYELASTVRQRGFVPQPVPPARVYEALQRMEREGALVSVREPSPSGPDRRRYRLASGGVERLDRWAMALRVAQRSLSAFLDGYDSRGKEVTPMSCECDCGETRQAVRVPASAERRPEPESVEARLARLEAELQELRSKS